MTPTTRLAATVFTAGLLALLNGCGASSSNNVSCSGGSCSVTLKGDGASAALLGSDLAFGGVENGRATLRVGGSQVSCAQGESVSAGPLSLACTEVTDDSVTLTASLG